MNRQKYFYHASPECDLKYIEPRRKTIPQDFQEGDVIFATESLSFSTMFLITHDDSWANGGTFNEIPYFVISDKDRFMKNDKGGCVYLVDSKAFKKLNNKEWYCKKKLKIRGSIHFSSGFMAMLVMGVQVYIVEPRIYLKIKKARDHGLSILNSQTSENEKNGYGNRKLEMYFSSKKLI